MCRASRRSLATSRSATTSSALVFIKQKTAYEMRMSDWSSDVCSSDLRRWTGISAVEQRHAGSGPFGPDLFAEHLHLHQGSGEHDRDADLQRRVADELHGEPGASDGAEHRRDHLPHFRQAEGAEIGRATG